jgi:hypothetical protein
MTSKIKERRLWYFTCQCGRKAQSHKKKNAKNEQCAICRSRHVPENQRSLFDVPAVEDAIEKLKKL